MSTRGGTQICGHKGYQSFAFNVHTCPLSNVIIVGYYYMIDYKVIY